ncbi:hypothetical protein DICPUDRAFT_149933 [Dictyostelium purpureum]|uniref:Rab-GAP TBC domain-containing protein n=1 Tax=Dictyostelium purpureum TaxID=5786 RepID=F0ZF15_DICPU|nr:uncharacterized protein DICPUDRAFT_149933 [Dictyostelium purpureum]EGC37442.1 hypothetical protein DICPUDRAFT_149933 [Dictyostelium purpureum]|eukprot:XP_003286006.1 hypothetical protein DICPUDRAFT_149933 [Dictyostelium purpureum]
MFTEKERLEAKKIRVIQDCLENPIDIEGLRMCAITEFGFVNNVLRKRIWPILLNIDTNNIINHSEHIIDHKDTDQVSKDVERSMWRFTRGKTQLRNRKKPELTRIVNSVLSLHSNLYYFQGYHEIASVLLLITDESLAFAMLERLSLNHFSDCMLPNFSEILKLLNYIFPLVSMVDQEVYDFLIKSGVQPMFAISWILTWFSHNLEELDLAARVYDYFLSSHPMASVYFSVSVITNLRDQLLKLECSFDSIHAFFTSNLPENLDLDKIIFEADKLIDKIPPNKIQIISKEPLLPTSPINHYPWDWMSINNAKRNSYKKTLLKNHKLSKNQKRHSQVFKVIFFILFGSLSLFGSLVFLSIKSPTTFNSLYSFFSPIILKILNFNEPNSPIKNYLANLLNYSMPIFNNNNNNNSNVLNNNTIN